MPHKIINNAETEDHLPAFISSYTSIFVSEIGDKVYYYITFQDFLCGGNNGNEIQ